MTRTKTFLSRVVLTVGLGLAAASAHAVPIVGPDFYWQLDGSGSPLPDGEYASRRLNLRWSGAAPHFVDLSGGFEQVELIPSLPTLLPSGYFVTMETWDCIGAFCDLTGATRPNFEIESLSVPEPGTLALFAVGLLGGAVVRRSSGKKTTQ